LDWTVFLGFGCVGFCKDFQFIGFQDWFFRFFRIGFSVFQDWLFGFFKGWIILVFQDTASKY